MDGLLLVDKPAGISSFDVIRQIRRVANTRKIGHTGTLDPLATGLLPLVVGKCTKLARFLSLDTKEYTFGMRLGVETDTGDSEGEVVRECGWQHIDEAAFRQAVAEFVGDIEQVPPAYSAIKVNGQRAYKLARQGEEVKLEARPVHIEALDVLGFDAPDARLHTRCSSGTYVRSLARDIGAALDSCAFTTSIRRTRVGSFRLDEATPLGEITPDNVSSLLLAPSEMMRDMTTYAASPSECTALSYGQSLVLSDDDATRLDLHVDDNVAVVDPAGELAAVTRVRETPDGRLLKPRRVLKAQ